jgi:hypothetical protein
MRSSAHRLHTTCASPSTLSTRGVYSPLRAVTFGLRTHAAQKRFTSCGRGLGSSA